MADRTYLEDIWVSSSETNSFFFSLKTRKKRKHRRFLTLQSFILSRDFKKSSNITIYITLMFVEEMLLIYFIRRENGRTQLQMIAAKKRREIQLSYILFTIHCYIKRRSGQHWRQLYPVLRGCASNHSHLQLYSLSICLLL